MGEHLSDDVIKTFIWAWAGLIAFFIESEILEPERAIFDVVLKP